MKLIIALVMLIASSLLIFAAFAQSQESPLLYETARKSGYSTSDASPYALSQRIGQIIKIVLGLIGTIFLVLTVYAGFLWMTAGGQEEQVTKAQNIIKRSVMGLIITLAAYSITYFVMYYLFASSGAQIY